MINPSDYKPKSWVFVYPYDGGPELRSMQFGTHHAAEIQQNLFVMERTEGLDQHDLDYGDEQEIVRDGTLIIEVNTASLNIQNILIDLVCGAPHTFGSTDEQSKEYFIERLLPDYDQAMYRIMLETRWDELDDPQYPDEIRGESENTSEFPPFSVRTEKDDLVGGGYKTVEEAVVYAKHFQKVEYGIRGKTWPCYIQNGHENSIQTVEHGEVGYPPYTVKDPNGVWEEGPFDTHEEAVTFAEEQVKFNRGEGQDYDYVCHIYDRDGEHVDTIGD